MGSPIVGYGFSDLLLFKHIITNGSELSPLITFSLVYMHKGPKAVGTFPFAAPYCVNAAESGGVICGEKNQNKTFLLTPVYNFFCNRLEKPHRKVDYIYVQFLC